jgi:hypothetical protein
MHRPLVERRSLTLRQIDERRPERREAGQRGFAARQVLEDGLQLAPENLLRGAVVGDVVHGHPQLTLAGPVGVGLQRDPHRQLAAQFERP